MLKVNQMRDRLIELIRNAPRTNVVYGNIRLDKPVQTLCTIADHLLANGVIITPCIVQHGGTHIRLGVNSEGKVIAESVFFSKEEAERALRKEDEGK